MRPWGRAGGSAGGGCEGGLRGRLDVERGWGGEATGTNGRENGRLGKCARGGPYPVEEGAVADGRIRETAVRRRDALQVLQDGKLAPEDGQPLHDRRILRIAPKLRRHEPLDAGPDGRVNHDPLQECRLSILCDGRDDGMLAPQTYAQGFLGEIESAGFHSGRRRGRGFGPAEDCDSESGSEEGSDDVWTEVPSCLCRWQSV